MTSSGGLGDEVGEGGCLVVMDLFVSQAGTVSAALHACEPCVHLKIRIHIRAKNKGTH